MSCHLYGYFQIPTLIYLFPSDTKSSLAETKKCKSCQADLTSVAKAARKEWQVSGAFVTGEVAKNGTYKQYLVRRCCESFSEVPKLVGVY